jgi:photosystem II stability/assembly factor-like uncharacterized protein
MTETIYLATGKGLATCQRENTTWRIIDRALQDQDVTCLIAHNGVILAGTTRGIQRSDDNGQHWRSVNDGLTNLHIRWLGYHPDTPDLEFAGTEPAGIFVSSAGTEQWSARPEVEALRDEHDWMLPYSPEAGCVRGFAFHGQRLYAAVEVGGVLRSNDKGQHWALAEGSDGNPDLSGPPDPFVYPDVHDLAVHPSNPDLVFAATGGGFYRSDDGGAHWDLIYDCYCRALWLDPNNPEHIIFGPADRVGSIGRIEESHDGGRTWHPASSGLDVPFPRTMPERIRQIGDELFTVLDDGRLLVASLSNLEWMFIEVDGVNAVTAMQG